MYYRTIQFVVILCFSGLLISCDNSSEEARHDVDEIHGEVSAEGGLNEVHLSNLQFRTLGMEVDTLSQRPIADVIYVNGQLEVPPQHEATVTAVLGGNVVSIEVIEGDKVSEGQPLAYLSHPELIKIQTDYVTAYNRSEFLEKEFQRRKKLYEAEVGSGKSFEEAKADYQTTLARVKGLEAQLKQLNLSIDPIRRGEIYERIPVVSPIDGYIEKVTVQLGRYIDPRTPMFRVVNIEHVHADFMVFEKDVHKVEKGQTIVFSVETVPGSELTAEIYSVGKQFEKDPKAVHVHAEIDEKQNYLIPGMYVTGRIHTSSETVLALPDEAVVEESGNSYLFTAEKSQQGGLTEWVFKAVEIRTGESAHGWVEIKLLEPWPENTLVAYNNAYYLISEMKKSETSHSH